MGLHQNMLSESVSQLALREPVVCNPDDTVRKAIQLMREKKLGCVIVTDEDRKPAGILTESMLTEQLSHGVISPGSPVSSQMTDQVPWVKLSDPIIDVLEAMQIKNIRFICVVDEDGRVAALTGQKGLMEYIADHFPEQVMIQRVGCAPYHDREGA